MVLCAERADLVGRGRRTGRDLDVLVAQRPEHRLGELRLRPPGLASDQDSIGRGAIPKRRVGRGEQHCRARRAAIGAAVGRGADDGHIDELGVGPEPELVAHFHVKGASRRYVEHDVVIGHRRRPFGEVPAREIRRGDPRGDFVRRPAGLADHRPVLSHELAGRVE
ncbi:MAG: hypothetical protein IPG46_03655 [Actinobacteria bacterium]|nr:hypothetical protein [Actinomycetota bacterium]